MDLIEVLDLTDSNGVDSPKAKQQPAYSLKAKSQPAIGSMATSVVHKEWDDSLMNLDSDAPITSHIDGSSVARNISVLSPLVVDSENKGRDDALSVSSS
jgi:hypothetical protein